MVAASEPIPALSKELLALPALTLALAAARNNARRRCR
jgi:hypothetical protein